MTRKTFRFARPCLLLLVLLVPGLLAAEDGAPGIRPGGPIPDDFPRFIVPGHEREMALLRELFWLHFQPAGPLITLWDEWMPMSTLWPARGGGDRGPLGCAQNDPGAVTGSAARWVEASYGGSSASHLWVASPSCWPRRASTGETPVPPNLRNRT